MTLSQVDILDVLKDVASAPPTVGTVRAAAEVLPFPSKPSANEILNKLDDMRLPQPVLDQARPFFLDAGFTLGEDKVFVQYDPRTLRYYTTANRDDVQLALLYLPPEFFDETRAWGSFGEFIESIQGQVKLLAQGRDLASSSFNQFLKSSNQRRNKTWSFVAWQYFDGILKRKDVLELVFDLPNRAPVATLDLGRLSDADRRTIVQILVGQLSLPGSPPARQVLETLMLAAAWPDSFRTAIVWQGAADADAEVIVAFAISKARFAAGEKRPGDTYLGALLGSVLPNLGAEQRRDLATLILRYGLVARPDSLAEIRGYLS